MHEPSRPVRPRHLIDLPTTIGGASYHTSWRGTQRNHEKRVRRNSQKNVVAVPFDKSDRPPKKPFARPPVTIHPPQPRGTRRRRTGCRPLYRRRPNSWAVDKHIGDRVYGIVAVNIGYVNPQFNPWADAAIDTRNFYINTWQQTRHRAWPNPPSFAPGGPSGPDRNDAWANRAEPVAPSLRWRRGRGQRTRQMDLPSIRPC
jgi:hypothetical protein